MTSSSAAKHRKTSKSLRVSAKPRRRALTAADLCDDEDAALSNAVSLAAARAVAEHPPMVADAGDEDAALSNAVSLAAARASLRPD